MTIHAASQPPASALHAALTCSDDFTGPTGLDAAIATLGTVAFGPDVNASAQVDEHLITVNTLAPMSVLRGAASLMHHGTIAATTGAVVDLPLARAAAYTASKAALSAWLAVIRREHRGDGLTVIDARFPHMDTGFAQRAVAGTPPPLPPGADPQAYVTALLDAIGTGARIVRAAPDGRPALKWLTRTDGRHWNTMRF